MRADIAGGKCQNLIKYRRPAGIQRLAELLGMGKIHIGVKVLGMHTEWLSSDPRLLNCKAVYCIRNVIFYKSDNRQHRSVVSEKGKVKPVCCNTGIEGYKGLQRHLTVGERGWRLGKPRQKDFVLFLSLIKWHVQHTWTHIYTYLQCLERGKKRENCETISAKICPL